MPLDRVTRLWDLPALTVAREGNVNRILQSIIASCGVFISGLLGWITFETENQAAMLQKEQSRLTFLEVFTEQTSSAMRDCNPTLLAFVKNAIDRLPNETEDDAKERQMYLLYYDKTVNMIDRCTAEKLAVTSAASAASGAPGEAAPVVPGVTRVAENIALQAGESAAEEAATPPPPAAEAAPEGAVAATVAAPAPPPEDERWLAVLASYEVGRDEQAAVEDAAKFQAALAASGDADLSVQAYVTRASNHYALVLAGPETGRDAANRLAAMARTRGWAGDAFTQQDRDWMLCAPADSVDALKACAPAAVADGGRQ